MGRRVVLRERLSQPQSLTGVDWGNPITRGLEAIETPTVPSGRDSGTLIAISGGLARQSTRAGQGYKGSGASSALYRNIGLTVNPSAGQTILALVVGTTGTDSRIFSVASPSSMILAIGSGQTTASKVRYFYRTPGADIGTGETTAVAFEAGIPHVAIMRYEPGFLSIFVDGKLDATQSATASGTSASSLQVAVGAVVRAGSASLFSSSSLVLGVYWNRALSDAEIASVSANPWQLFAPQSQVINTAAAVSVYRPGSDVTVNGWTSTPSGTLASCIDDPTLDRADFITSPDLSSPATLAWNSPLPAGNWSVSVDGVRVGTAGQVRVVCLDAGGTSVGNTSWQVLTGTDTTYTLPVTTTATSTQFRIEVQ
ncbi:hypothetical protein UFOVP336_2 [uncultured Caudovirales phage]|uniref:Concanavalin A-like lectin/glucanases superfamily n=1 Tax=uncultured Caudovirales phage TaxID=2100421 RepID=A0A6J5LYG3_9CAUD|nr:hypothetical protein UFOVP336_2 [uncultured Caudovirales phage]